MFRIVARTLQMWITSLPFLFISIVWSLNIHLWSFIRFSLGLYFLFFIYPQIFHSMTFLANTLQTCIKAIANLLIFLLVQDFFLFPRTLRRTDVWDLRGSFLWIMRGRWGVYFFKKKLLITTFRSASSFYIAIFP